MYNCVCSFCEGLHRMELKSLSLKNSRRPCKGTSPVMSYVKESCFTSHKSAFCEVSSHSKCWLTNILRVGLAWGRGGGYSVFQVMGMIEWDRRALLTTNLQIVLNTQTKTNPYLSQATQKNTCQIFLPQKLPQTTISNPPKFFEHPLHLKFGVPSPPPGLKVAMKHTCPSHGLRTFCGKFVRLQITSLEREKH